MPESVHKILVLWTDSLSGVILLIGQLSEEIRESRNKDLKYSGEVIRGKHLGYQRNKTFFIYLCFPRFQFFRVWENRLKRLKNKFARSIRTIRPSKESEDFISSDATTINVILMRLAKKFLIIIMKSKGFYVFMHFVMNTV